jgi:hypothetical protein
MTIDNKSKPFYLPQINSPHEDIIADLDNYNIEHSSFHVNPNMINPSQGFVYSDNVNGVNADKPIWVDKDMNILDGHHRWVRSLSKEEPIFIIKIMLDHKDACRILNKIQDILDYNNTEKNEVISQDVINTYNDIDSNIDDFLGDLEKNNNMLFEENSNEKKETITAYRKNPIKENSAIGNFFMLEPIDGYSKYEIDFNNVLDTNQLGIIVNNGQESIDVLSKIWFPNINFEKLSTKYNIRPINLKTKAITEKTKAMGYDGIKYNKLLQGFK